MARALLMLKLAETPTEQLFRLNRVLFFVPQVFSAFEYSKRRIAKFSGSPYTTEEQESRLVPAAFRRLLSGVKHGGAAREFAKNLGPSVYELASLRQLRVVVCLDWMPVRLPLKERVVPQGF